MKIINQQYKNIQELRENLDLSAINVEQTLIQIFSGFILKEEIQAIQQIFEEKNNKATFIGTTTAGEIFAGRTAKKSIVVSITEFEQTRVNHYHFCNDSDLQLGIGIAQSMNQADIKAGILFLSGLTLNATRVVEGIRSVNATLPIAGGVAGDNGFLKETFVFNQQSIYNKGAVVVALNSQILRVFNDYQLGWQPIGPVMTVTKIEENRLYELDGISVEKVYRKYFGDRIADKLPFSATEFPLITNDEGMQFCHIFTHKYADGSMQIAANFATGDNVRFSFGNVDLIIERSKAAIKEYEKLKPEVIFNFSCICRSTFLQTKVSLELEHFNFIAPTCGFFTYGEFFQKNNNLYLLNNSLTVLGLSENKIQTQVNDLEEYKNYNVYDNKHFMILDALTHLTNRVIADLEASNSELKAIQNKLKEQANRDYLTNLYNRRYFNEIANDFIELSIRDKKPISIIMLDIDNFKQINDKYGHAVGDEILKSLALILLNSTRSSDVVSRFGGEEFTILLPLTDIHSAFKLAEKLRLAVQNTQLSCNFVINVTISLGVSQFDVKNDKSILEALERGDNGLYQAKDNGRNKVAMI
ncbi:MAG: diguanylate cyclase (GGDEF)-like protein [Psychromonas sp.]|jgi:diguanylate cyclase (GGDEF)-like protein|uniref:sensor domain-containing diguanylate cyclase n=1 Tax=Psychromonas sp. TaxID=1884585 RepID=UPI0039E611D1